MLLCVDVENPAPALLEVSTHIRERFPGVDPTLVEAAVRLAHRDIALRRSRPLTREVEVAAQERLAFALQAG